LFSTGRFAFFGVRWLDAALAVPFFLSAPPTAIVQDAELTQNESGVKPPHSKKGSKLLLDKHKLNTPLPPPSADSTKKYLAG
jgi:hypothetical protein